MLTWPSISIFGIFAVNGKINVIRGDLLRFGGREIAMYIDNRGRAKLLLAAGIIGMVAQERLSLMNGGLLKSVALMTLVISVGLLFSSHGEAFRAGYEEARRKRTLTDS